MGNDTFSQKQSHVYRVLHFGDQCPWRLWVVEQAKLAAQKTGGKVEVFDITDHPDMAQKYQMFYPFMTVIDDEIRLPAPTPADRLVRIVEKGVTNATMQEHTPDPAAYAESVKPLNPENIADTCSLCIPPRLLNGCQAKQAWAQKVGLKIPGGFLGFIAYHEGKAVGVVEFLPSTVVPYPLSERAPSIAFITCIYSSEDVENTSDYRPHVLERLMEYLPSLGYSKVQVVAGQLTAYPNGPACFFAHHGFAEINDLGTIFLGNGVDRIWLLEKLI